MLHAEKHHPNRSCNVGVTVIFHPSKARGRTEGMRLRFSDTTIFVECTNRRGPFHAPPTPPPPPSHQISASISFFFLSESAWERRPPSSKRFSVFSRSSMDPFVADAEEGAVELEPPTFRFFGLASPEFAGAFVFVALGFAGA